MADSLDRRGLDQRGLDQRDLDQIRHHGLDAAEVRRQLGLLAEPPPPTRLDRPCTVGDGIVRLEDSEHERLQNLYRAEQSKGRFSKLVPASGAASRMFRSLVAVHRGEGTEADREDARRLLRELPRFPFYSRLKEELAAAGRDLERLRESGEDREIAAALVGERDGLGLASLPKALVPFHHPEDARGPTSLTPLEEHLVEAAEHLRDRDGRCRVHFTVPQHQEMAFREQLREIAGRLEPHYRVRLEVSLSVQSPETDTVAGAVDALGRGTGEPFRDDEGRLLFRPGGHGALLRNLARFGGDLVFLRNIDNVQPVHRRREVLRWNRLLGGYLVAVEEAVAEILSRLERARAEDPEIDAEIRRIAELFGQPDLLSVLGSPPRAKQAFLADLLDRPLRVAGVVPNAGEPGGGPFWVTPAGEAGSSAAVPGEAESEGIVGRGRVGEWRPTPQIVEMSQIDHDRPEQARAVAGATHFNPVHLVCRLRSHRGDAYDLTRFVEPAAVFVSKKSHRGRDLLALEHPGLWNGAMAHWNTIFVEVPGEIFAPVKTVFDLLRPEHQPPELPSPEHRGSGSTGGVA